MKNIEDLLECPKCKTSWDGGDIYEHFKEHYCETMPLLEAEKEALETAGQYGWTKENPKSFKKIITGVELSWDHPKHRDGVSYWLCTECKACWDRFTGEEVDYNKI